MKKQSPKIKQPMSDELTASLLNLVETKFYSGHPKTFAQDRKRLLAWVVYYPASWLDKRGVTLPPERYREIMVKIILDAAEHGNLAEVKYLPAWLAQTVQSHWAIHGEDYYSEAKTMRRMVEHALVVAGRHVQAAPDPIREMAAAKRLLAVSKGRKTAVRRPEGKQLTML
jgi:hypothetical protein